MRFSMKRVAPAITSSPSLRRRGGIGGERPRIEELAKLAVARAGHRRPSPGPRLGRPRRRVTILIKFQRACRLGLEGIERAPRRAVPHGRGAAVVRRRCTRGQPLSPTPQFFLGGGPRGGRQVSESQIQGRGRVWRAPSSRLRVSRRTQRAAVRNLDIGRTRTFNVDSHRVKPAIDVRL